MIGVAGSLWSVPGPERTAVAAQLRAAGLRRAHWDTTDGRFAAAGGFTAAEAADLAAAAGFDSEAHVMAEHSATAVDAWADFCDVVFVHVESADWQEAATRVERRGAQPGLALSPGTPLAVVEGLPADVPVLCMAITPGQAGSAFDLNVLERVAALRASAPERRIGIDGGVTRAHADAAAAAGADWVVVGTDLVFGGEERWGDLLAD